MSSPSIDAKVNPQTGLVDVTQLEYDLSTFSGRLRHFASVTSPLTLFVTRSELFQAQHRIKEIELKRFVSSCEANEYYRFKKLISSSVHPDTGDLIPLPFRLSAFVPTNLIVVFGMLLPNPSTTAIIFWQWCNQSLNVAVNYFNANKSNPMNFSEVTIAYTAATSAAVSISLGLSKYSVHPVLTRLIPFFSVATAGVVNLSAMRYKELVHGVQIKDQVTGQSLGDSKIAGKYAVGMTATSRILTSIPTLIVPPLAMTWLHSKNLLGPVKGIRAKSIQMGLIASSLFIGLPPAIAFYPQYPVVPVSRLEPEFQNSLDQNGNLITHVQFSKGL